MESRNGFTECTGCMCACSVDTSYNSEEQRAKKRATTRHIFEAIKKFKNSGTMLKCKYAENIECVFTHECVKIVSLKTADKLKSKGYETNSVVTVFKIPLLKIPVKCMVFYCKMELNR